MATQNPVEMHGTYPLPEAQLDRFAMKLQIGYPRHADELDMLAGAVGTVEGNGSPNEPVLAVGQLAEIQRRVAKVAAELSVRDYLVQLAEASRRHPRVTLGLSPRGLLVWQRVAQAWAYLKHRDFVTPDDVLDVARPVLAVRLGLEQDGATDVVGEILDAVSVPLFSESVLK
jgi:MoxR-like ATPase